MITSKQNQFLKLVKELRTKKGRNKHKKLVIEGKKFILDCLKLGVNFDFILYDNSNEEFITKCILPFFEGNDNYVLSFENDDLPKVLEVTNEVLNSISAQSTPQGVLAVVSQPKCELRKPTTDFLVLDGLQDAGNVGTIIRTALATNFSHIFLLDCVDVFSDKVINASMTAVFKVNLHKASKAEFINAYKDCNLPLYVADLDGTNALQTQRDCGIIGLVIGNEGNGISPDIRALAHKVITLPMDKNIESLNASVSAGILMYILKYNLKGDR